MIDQMFIPRLSQYDPVVSSEGTLDPLGLFPISDKLALLLFPGLRERMSHPRFLTLIALGTVICSDFDDDVVASDGVTEPWQIFEWYVVQSLVTTFRKEDPTQLRGLPGVEKVTSAITNNIPLNRANYLKLPTVFGFTGVYRTLAKELKLIEGNRLGEFGDELVRAWEQEENQYGFYANPEGPGKELRKKLFDAIKDSLENAVVKRNTNWTGFYNLGQHIAPYKLNKKEEEIIYKAVLGKREQLSREIIKFYETKDAAGLWYKVKSEKQLQMALRKVASPKLKEILDLIMLYEEFARKLQDAFDIILFLMTGNNGLSVKDLTKHSEFGKLLRDTHLLYDQTYQKLEQHGIAGDFEKRFSSFSLKYTVEEAILNLLKHHEITQKNKPPHGKKAWYSRSEDGRLYIEAATRKDERPELTDEYVHYYRTRPIYSFLRDLGKVRGANGD
ncbi:MAG: hypothetical protein KKA84_13625 [Bacteroidetes bacterium]|nr:hypothetical protein [Bacteroidota bacterium]